MDHLKFQIFALLYGSCIGSFLNVVIYRLPKNKDLVFERSSCPKCGHQIRWYENIPIFSYLFLKGRCSQCKTKISWRYPLTEAITALAAFYLTPASLNFADIVHYLFLFATFCIFMCHLQIDFDHKILPDSLNIILFSLFLSYAIFHFSWVHWLSGGLLGFLFPLAFTWIFYLLRGQVGLGGGDIKLFGILGIFLGPEMIMKNIFLSCFLGAVVGGLLLLQKKMKREDTIPFGPYIIFIAGIQIFFPEVFDLFNRFIL